MSSYLYCTDFLLVVKLLLLSYRVCYTQKKSIAHKNNLAYQQKTKKILPYERKKVL